MQFRPNRPFRNLGIYEFRGKSVVLLKRSEVLSFLFSPANWKLHGPVDYRVSHGNIYQRGHWTRWTDEDLVDTGATADPSRLDILMKWNNKCDLGN